MVRLTPQQEGETKHYFRQLVSSSHLLVSTRDMWPLRAARRSCSACWLLMTRRPRCESFDLSPEVHGGWAGGRVGSRGGGGGTASLKVGTHYQTPAPAFRHCLLRVTIFEGHIPLPRKSNILNTKLSIKVIQSLLKSFLYKECHVSNTIEGITWILLQVCATIMFLVWSRPTPFFAPKGVDSP